MSSSHPPGSSTVNNGTITVPLAPHTVPSFLSNPPRQQLEQYQVISAQKECADFSLEELRLVDYEKGHGAHSWKTDKSPAMPSARPLQRLRRTDNKKHESHLALLTGPAVEVRVGPVTSVLSPPDNSTTWFLPKRLVSRHSPFLAAAYHRDVKERRENLIELPDDDPIVFALFVEWLYYGEYTIEPLLLPLRTKTDSVSVDAECWVLGDKLSCTEFKCCAMRRLYAQHTATLFSRSISTHDVQFACEKSAEASKLRELYVDLVATHFGRQYRVLGTVDEWDKIVMNQSDLRQLLLRSLRLDADKRNFVKSEAYYLEDCDAPP